MPQYEQPYGGEEGSANFEESYRAALEPFWAQQKQEISQSSTDISEYKSQQLPLARIKKASTPRARASVIVCLVISAVSAVLTHVSV